MNQLKQGGGVNPLGTAPVGALLRQFAVPSIIAMMVGSIYNLVDQFFIGHYVGILGNSATNVAHPLTNCCVAIALLCGYGGAANFNLCMGRGERDKAPRYIGNAAAGMFLGGVLLCVVTQVFMDPLLRAFGSPDDVLPYAREYVRIVAFGFPFMILTSGGGHLIRADGAPRITMLTSISGALINVVLDALFIIVFEWGMAGAALATIIGQIFSGCLVIWYLITQFKTVPLRRNHYRLRAGIMGRVCSLGMASFFNQIAMLLTTVVLNNSMRHYGGLSEFGESIPLAVGGITMKVFQLGFGVIIGIGQGVQPIISFNYGARQYDRVRKGYRLALCCGAVMSVTMFVLFQFFPRQLLGLFGDGSEIYYQCGELFFRVFLLMTFVNFVQPITSTFFTSIGKPLKGVFLSLTRQVIFFIPLLIIVPWFFGFHGVLYTGPVADTAALTVSAILAAYELKKMKRMEPDAKKD